MPVLSFAPVTAGPLEDALDAMYWGHNETALSFFVRSLNKATQKRNTI